METDRAALGKALAFASPVENTGCAKWYPALSSEHADAILAAARAHLDTLPKTKTMVEVWRVEYASNWVPRTETFLTCEEANRWARGAIPLAYVSCVKVTGPHQQEVPST
jgi:hypothetical protein